MNEGGDQSVVRNQLTREMAGKNDNHDIQKIGFSGLKNVDCSRNRNDFSLLCIEKKNIKIYKSV